MMMKKNERVNEEPGVEGVPPVVLQVACMNLRHKLMYCDERQARAGQVDDSSDTRVFYCVKTQESLGPDGEVVGVKECQGGNGAARSCYVASPFGSQSSTMGKA